MNCVSEAASSSIPQKSVPSASPAGRLKPVPIGSTMTMSAMSSTVWPLSTSGYGGGACWPMFGVTTRRGPMIPMWSQKEADPGPPL